MAYREPEGPLWDLPASQLRAELAVDTDCAIAKRYSVSRNTIAHIRERWGFSVHPRGGFRVGSGRKKEKRDE